MCDCECIRLDFFRESCVRARKQYHCHECNQPIEIGDRYLYIVGKWDGEFSTIKQCLPCRNLMDWLTSKLRMCICYGDLKQTLIDSEIIYFDKAANSWVVHPHDISIRMDSFGFPRLTFQ